MRLDVSASLVALLFALQACNPQGDGSASSGAPVADQPPAEQQKPADEQKDPTLADQYIDGVTAGLVKDGVKQEDADALSAAVKADAHAGAAGLNLQNDPAGDPGNDPAKVFADIPGLMVKHANELKLEALIQKIIDQSADFIGQKVASNDKQGLFEAFAKSFFSAATDAQVADATAGMMRNLNAVVPESQLEKAAPEFFGGMFDVIKEVHKDFDFAANIDKIAAASEAVGNPSIATDLFGKSMEFASKHIPAEKLDESLGKLNDKATAFISEQPKEKVAGMMAKLNAAVMKNVDATNAAILQAEIIAAVAKVDPTLNQAFQDAREQEYKNAKIDPKKVTEVNASTEAQIKCPPGTVLYEGGCAAADTGTPQENESPSASSYWVSDETKEPRAFGQLSEAQIKALGVPADKFAEFKSAEMTCGEGQVKALRIRFIENVKTFGPDCMSNDSTPPK